MRKNVRKESMSHLMGTNRFDRLMLRLILLGMGSILMIQFFLAIPSTRSHLMSKVPAVDSVSKEGRVQADGGDLTIRVLSSDLPQNAWVFVDGKEVAQFSDRAVSVHVKDQSQISLRVNGPGIYRFIIENDDPSIAFPPSGYEVEVPGDQVTKLWPVELIP
ncbi:hypothetical protein DNHGIG_37650 [Collibacillus ludicampi]|uniref:DUF4115 domain-containing protein n=1 Tax=Collibacillus ludicampi TaxID=2771369 RepID=A0AAV4LKB2_9BACL|nr:hypothetical protein [Collibacillus ludicampi]GIM48216.1 hypothetical protein DNHGIG_37650 [Collibacillus ludicampi]